MAIDIACPAQNSTQTVVLGAGATGIISASGTAIPDGGTPTDVWVRICGRAYAGTFDATNPGPVPATPPANAQCKDNAGAVALAGWYLDQIPGAVCMQTGVGAPNTLVVWAKFTMAGPYSPPNFVHFEGTCGFTTSCPPPATFMPPSMYSRPAIVALSTTPRAWRVEGDSEALKGVWRLELRGTDKGVCTWDNAAGAAETFLVRLSCESPVASLWRLTFQLNNDRLCYTLSADAWQAMGANVLALAPAETKCGFAPPATIRVTPG